MDAKVTAILDLYHVRMKEEEQAHRLPNADIDQFLLPVGPASGQLINILAKSLPAPHILELGTSYGYSTIWLAEAARASGGKLTTMELQDYKSAHAREMAEKAGLAGHVDFRVGDAVEMIGQVAGNFDFVLVDLWKDLYVPCLEAFYPKLNKGAIIVADNMIYPAPEGVLRYARAVRAKPGITSLLVPVGSGLEISCYERSYPAIG